MRGLLIVDKAEGPTSHDVVRLARRAFGTRAVGHAGTLDPMASGVLVLGIGEGTKLLAHLTLDDKRYAARVTLGAETDTLDALGQVVERAELPAGLSLAQVRAAAASFHGEILQRAPEYSAIKQGGEALYARMRRGEQVVAPERTVIVHELSIDALAEDCIELTLHCGKGFYVRSLARDLARALGTRGHLSRLRRLASGSFELSAALPFETLAAASRNDPADAHARGATLAALLPLSAAVAGFPQLTPTDLGIEDVRHGRALVPERIAAGDLPGEGAGPVAVLDPAGELLALAHVRDGKLHVTRGFGPA
jgi:tRNA pseudouridine55 synthase